MPYYGTGTIENILADIYNALAAITGTYALNFIDYQRIEVSGANPADYPGVYINHLRTDKVRLLRNLVKNETTIVLIGWYWGETEGQLVTELNGFVEAIKDAVMADPYRNSNAYDTNIAIIATDGGTRFPQAQCMISLTVVFYSDE